MFNTLLILKPPSVPLVNPPAWAGGADNRGGNSVFNVLKEVWRNPHARGISGK
jgi:hypothetical protein